MEALKQKLRFWLAVFDCKVWVRIYFVEAYLAFYRGDKFECAQHEQAMRDCEHRLKLLNFFKENNYECRY